MAGHARRPLLRPFVAATASLLVAGVVMNLMVPGATSLGDFPARFR